MDRRSYERDIVKPGAGGDKDTGDLRGKLPFPSVVYMLYV